VTTTRIDAIDFWRGIVLAIIFVNHIPGNVLSAFTPRNYGFSDASEAFVFISGVSVALAYGRRFRGGAALSAAWPLIRRALRLYFVHLALTASALALFGVATTLSGNEALLVDHGCAAPFIDPVRGWFEIATLSHQIDYFNILPLYVALLIFAPALFLIAVRDRSCMLLASSVLYLSARSFAAIVHSGPQHGEWYFNPVAWQFMFAIGIFVGLTIQEGNLPLRQGVYRLGLAFSFVSAVVVSNVGGLVPGLVERAGEFLDWSKTELGSVRIVAFLALAYSIYCSGLTGRLRSTRIYPAFSLLGRNALPVFCAESLLSAFGQILNETWVSSPVLDVLFVTAGLCVILAIASLLEYSRESNWLAAG
jgi:hypothetical protein